jgi:hypothetical protein
VRWSARRDAFTAKQQMAAIGGIRGGNRFCGKTERSKSRGDQIAEAVHARTFAVKRLMATICGGTRGFPADGAAAGETRKNLSRARLKSDLRDRASRERNWASTARAGNGRSVRPFVLEYRILGRGPGVTQPGK